MTRVEAAAPKREGTQIHAMEDQTITTRVGVVQGLEMGEMETAREKDVLSS